MDGASVLVTAEHLMKDIGLITVYVRIKSACLGAQ